MNDKAASSREIIVSKLAHVILVHKRNIHFQALSEIDLSSGTDHTVRNSLFLARVFQLVFSVRLLNHKLRWCNKDSGQN